VTVVNKLTQLLNITYPIIQGGMGNISDPYLAAAISNAGGLGTIGVGDLPVNEAVYKVTKMLKQTSNPCCVNIPIAVHPNVRHIVQQMINLNVPVVSLSAGNPAPFISLLQQHKIIVICVIATVRQAKKAEKAGADIIVCEGYEAAGINAKNESTTMSLIPQVVQQVNIPVVAAGGIADGKGLAAALALGASGVQMGTRFIATKEAPYHEIYKQAIIQATDESTVIVGRKFNRIRRLIRSEYTSKLLEIENKYDDSALFSEQTTETHHKIGALDGDMKNGFINGGQIAGLIEDCPSVYDLLETMTADAKQILKQSLGKLE
jgi:enoyl-[acyl-carrier protein] reductase II